MGKRTAANERRRLGSEGASMRPDASIPEGHMGEGGMITIGRQMSEQSGLERVMINGGQTLLLLYQPLHTQFRHTALLT